MSDDQYVYGGRYRFLRRWRLMSGGMLDCPLPPLPLVNTMAADLAADLALSRHVRSLGGRAQAVEQAAWLAAQDPPPQTVMTADADGQPVEVPNPDYAVWHDAGEMLAAAAAEADLQHLLRTRGETLAINPETGATEPPYSLSVPPVPPFNPIAQTADWHDGAWIVRDLTPAELATWPLRPAVAVTKMRFEALLLSVLGEARTHGILDMPDIARRLSLASVVSRLDVFALAADLAAGALVTHEEIAALEQGWPLEGAE